MRNFTKHLSLAAVSVAVLVLSACFGTASNPVSTSEGEATVVIQTKTNNVNRLSKPGLGKSAAITLDSLIVTAISNASTPDTVIVKLGVGDSGFSSVATSDQNIGIVLNLKALRNWTISAKTIDVNDSIIQEGSVVTGNLFAGQTKIVTLNATPNYTIYTATFNFPDSIQSPTGNFKQKITFNKIELFFDGVMADDSVGTLAPSVNQVLSYDYVPTGVLAPDSVTLKVFGNIENADTPWNAGSNLLYDTTVAISTLSAVYPATNSVPLLWRGPVDGVVDLTVEIEKVGQVAIDGETNPIVLSKK